MALYGLYTALDCWFVVVEVLAKLTCCGVAKVLFHIRMEILMLMSW